MIYIDDSEPEGVLEPSFPYRDVTIQKGVDANQLYDIISEVGRGKFGTVYKCQDKSTGLKLAAKFVPIPKREDRRNVEREVEIMNSLQHHLIIQLYAAYEHQKMMCVVQELVEGGELFDRVVDDEFILNERVCVVFIRQLCEAMEYIHRHNILHLDLKPENILCLTEGGNRIKIIDFGLARKYDPDKKLQILFGTPEFVAPEVVNFDCISYGTDMWSVGVITYVLISGLSPFMGETDIETMANVTIAKYDFEDDSFRNVSPECLNFISKLLVKDLVNRMNASQCLQHKWLEKRSKPSSKNKTKFTNVKTTKLKDAKSLLITLPNDSANVEASKAEACGDLTEELEATKENLKNFIERWEAHPNSPYVFDVEENVIAPLTGNEYKKFHGANSILSSRAFSPSPCESLSTITDDEKKEVQSDLVIEGQNAADVPASKSNEKLFQRSCSSSATLMSSQSPFENEIYQSTSSFMNLEQRSLRSYLHTFDRRNSDTACLLGRRSSGERVNLANEIKKLSDHLLMLAEINTKLDNEVKAEANEVHNAKTNKPIKSKNQLKIVKATKKAKEGSKNISDAAIAQSTGVIDVTSTSASDCFNHLNTTNTRTTSLTWRLQKSLDDTPTLNNNKFKNIIASNSNSAITVAKKTASVTEAASIKRAKFRINQMSRDVPIGLPDMHQTVYLEEAANNTKDCLLHLLEKYNEARTRNPLGRHQSISVDYNFSDNLEYRSMSSINAFFQRHSHTGDNVRQLQAQLKDRTGKNQ
ncbi:calcium/calmodulin-dependent protein kinase type II [Glossina fuscipes]|uniref:Calcium/calmodulin-dependent protein kinase type II n=1 Tax=Glossina fuscipes TaxID=7396 RepID=A0A9C5ZF52_9MUSC|nr:calcium/calmodulin-dependent protein kinase type II [Glossina fuscipes]